MDTHKLANICLCLTYVIDTDKIGKRPSVGKNQSFAYNRVLRVYLYALSTKLLAVLFNSRRVCRITREETYN